MTEDIISEQEASAIAGVSTRTLYKFAETGYLTLSTLDNGLSGFSKGELNSLFGLNRNPAHSMTPANTAGCGMNDNAVPEEEISTSDVSFQVTDSDLKLKNTLQEAQSQVIKLLEQENAKLHAETEWLKKRLEWFEEKSERDQMLLLSETQTIHRLVNQSQRSKSLAQHILEWLGVETQNNGQKLITGSAQVINRPQIDQEQTKQAANS